MRGEEEGGLTSHCEVFGFHSELLETSEGGVTCLMHRLARSLCLLC